MSSIAYALTPELREKLKRPLGILVSGSFTETIRQLKQMIAKENPPCLITVGDTVSRNSLRGGIQPQLIIVDNLAMRKNVHPVQAAVEKVFTVVNPAGTITKAAEQAVCTAIEKKEHVKLIVDGEEDLLTLIAIKCVSETSLVVYGQPREGIVIVKVTAEKKKEIGEILDVMRRARKV